MSVKDFIPRPEGSAPDSAEHLDWLDTLRDRQCIDYQLVVSSVSSVDETYLFSVSQNATRKITVSNLGRLYGTVSSVALAMPSIFSVSGSPVTGSGTLSATLVNQTSNVVFAGPASGASSAPSFRAMVNADLPAATQLSAPVTVTAATYTVTLTDRYLIANRAGTLTVTLPAAGTITGREITIKTISAAVASDASNVVGQRTTAAATAILEAHVGKWTKLVSDATNWVVMETNDDNALLLE